MTTIRRLFCVAMLVVLAGCKTDLYSGLSEREANDMLAALLSNNIQAEKTVVGDTGITVSVADEDVLFALDILSRHGFPRQSRGSLGSVFEKSGIMSSPFEERVRFIYALGEEVSHTLTEIDGVLTARVHIVMAEEAELGRPAAPSSAAVFIKHVADKNLEVFVPQIRRLVGNSIEGVDYNDVTVLLMPAEPMAQDTPTLRPATENIFGIEVAREHAAQAWLWLQGAAAAAGAMVLLVIILLAALMRRKSSSGSASVPAEVPGE
ncbi:MAG: type III secretion inner membrane ring lipoprotein SctJ [Pseudomonadota bacterium]